MTKKNIPKMTEAPEQISADELDLILNPQPPKKLVKSTKQKKEVTFPDSEEPEIIENIPTITEKIEVKVKPLAPAQNQRKQVEIKVSEEIEYVIKETVKFDLNWYYLYLVFTKPYRIYAAWFNKKFNSIPTDENEWLYEKDADIKTKNLLKDADTNAIHAILKRKLIEKEELISIHRELDHMIYDSDDEKLVFRSEK